MPTSALLHLANHRRVSYAELLTADGLRVGVLASHLVLRVSGGPTKFSTCSTAAIASAQSLCCLPIHSERASTVSLCHPPVPELQRRPISPAVLQPTASCLSAPSARSQSAVMPKGRKLPSSESPSSTLQVVATPSIARQPSARSSIVCTVCRQRPWSKCRVSCGACIGVGRLVWPRGHSLK